jgi:D-alanyl-D-alanine carboxypeptidase
MTAAARSVEWKRVFQSLSVILLALCILAGLQDDAHANRKKKRAPAYAPPYAEMVVDLGSGRVLKAVNADSPRFPASITKVMTIYLLFEAVEAGRFSLDSDLEVSRFAASQPPSKLGLRPGSTITVEQAILALITKSANDVAVVVAENLAGSQEAFARQMTRKARSLGMADTTFRNASGLPDRAQVTTARDLITLGVAIKRDFPDRYEMFSRRSFTFRGAVHRNHNRLLGRVKGVDGIKTGFTRASGFNLLTSARQGDRQIMTVVLGGSSGRARDQRVAALVADHLPDAVATTRLAAIGRKRAPAAEAPAPVERPEAAAVAAADPIATASSTRLDAKPAARRRIRPAETDRSSGARPCGRRPRGQGRRGRAAPRCPRADPRRARRTGDGVGHGRTAPAPETPGRAEPRARTDAARHRAGDRRGRLDYPARRDR